MQIKTTTQQHDEKTKTIRLNRTVWAIVDAGDFEKLSKFRWRLRHSNSCFYAVRRLHKNGKTIEIPMHRLIAKTPPGLQCHHINRNTLDNRKTNLLNLSPDAHAIEHGKK